ncbi:uncharacterized protein V1510DRAFT_381439 [Dipodascopsis tothii]|uniref:uncharacterized protein n=1 Tax=Dipodascopsis tothii TaxID=44089 RepID=UPI0034CDC6A4
MVVLAASVCTRGGKAVLSRQFVDMPKARIEALLAAFPTLTQSGTQHTTVEDENVRYVYQPLEELYMVLITNRQSNILQDISTLHLFAQVVTTLCKSIDEREILNNSFELLGAFDEIVAQGYKENLTLPQIKTFLEMESHEEKIQEIIERNKEAEANEERKRRAKQFEVQRREMSKRGVPSSLRKFPSSSSEYAPVTRAPATNEAYKPVAAPKTAKAPVRGKGLQLGKKSKATDMYETVRNEIGITEDAPLVAASPAPEEREASATPSQASHTKPVRENDGVLVSIVESASGSIGRDGSVQGLEVKGDLQLQIADPALAKIRLAVDLDAANLAPYKTHPNVDKALFSSSKVIGLKDAARGFPANNNPVGVLRWRLATRADDNSLLPLSFNCWLSQNDGQFDITIEYELLGEDDHLKDVIVGIPLPGEATVNSDDATYEFEDGRLEWHLGELSHDLGNASGSFDFSAEGDDENAFFPMGVVYQKVKPFAPVSVRAVTMAESGEDVPFNTGTHVSVDAFTIV